MNTWEEYNLERVGVKVIAKDNSKSWKLKNLSTVLFIKKLIFIKLQLENMIFVILYNVFCVGKLL